MSFFRSSFFHKIATIVVTVGAVAAHILIPATAVFTLGPLGIPVASLVTGGLALAAAQGITPNRQVAAVAEAAIKKTP